MKSRKSKPSFACKDIIGNHPSKHPFGKFTQSSDGFSNNGVPHRTIFEIEEHRDQIVTCLRDALVQHHASPEAIERDKRRREAMLRLGFEAQQSRISHFPISPSTRKGNLGEVFLAEYLKVSADIELPVYRLRYNPNIDQSMKGDDVLAFDFDSEPVRIIVGESKFRTTPSKAAVVKIVEGLVNSHKGGIPVSLQFVADRLFESGKEALGEKVLDCVKLLVIDRLRLDYVGLLMGDNRCAQRISEHAECALHRLVMISFGINDPESLIEPCYCDLEDI